MGFLLGIEIIHYWIRSPFFKFLSHPLKLENFNVWTLLSLGTTTTTTRISHTKKINYLNTNHMKITYQDINKDNLTQKWRQPLPKMKTTSPKSKMTLPKNKDNLAQKKHKTYKKINYLTTIHIERACQLSNVYKT